MGRLPKRLLKESLGPKLNKTAGAEMGSKERPRQMQKREAEPEMRANETPKSMQKEAKTSGYDLVRGGSYAQGPCRTRGYTTAGPIIESWWRRWRYWKGNTGPSPKRYRGGYQAQ